MEWICKLLFILFSLGATQSVSYTITDRVYFDIMIADKPAGRMVIGLFGKVAPKTVKNFLMIATVGINGKTYTGSHFHRVIKKFVIQGGDILYNDGTGSTSIYGEYFNDENFDISHSGPGFVSMANAGKNTNGCQFFITTIATPWLDGHHTIFGKVLEGIDTIFKIEQTKTDTDDRPTVPIIIYKSGILPTPESYEFVDDYYDTWSWIKATALPLGFSFSILGIFHWMIKQMNI